MANKKLSSDDERREHRLESYKKRNQKLKHYAVGYSISSPEEMKITQAIDKAIADKGVSGNSFIKSVLQQWLKDNGYLE